MVTVETRHVVLWMVLFTGANIGVKGAYVFLVLFLASALTPDVYASFGVLYALQCASTALATVGLRETTTARLKTYSSNSRRQALYRSMSGLFGTTALLALIILFPLVVFLGEAGTSLIQSISAILMGVVIGYGVLQAYFHRLDNRDAAALLANAGIPFCCVIGMIIGAWWNHDLALIFILGLAWAAIALIALILNGQIYLGVLPPLREIPRELACIGPYLIMGVFSWLSGYGMVFIIDLRFEAIHVATFTFLYTISSSSQLIANSLNYVWGPRFYQLFNEGAMAHAESRNRFFYSLLAGVLGLVGALSVALLPWITSIIGGNLSHYGDFRLELALLMSGYVVSISWWYGQNYFYVAGYGRALMHLSLWSGGLGLVLWIICIMFLGPIGIFVGYMIQMITNAFTMWVVGNRYWRLRPPWFAIIIGCAITYSGLFFPIP
jgi:O-antigen/teichoic acid export membrane protein